MNLVVAADTHLSSCIWSSLPEVVGDAVDAFQQAAAIARFENAPLIVAGDLFTQDPISRSVVLAAIEAKPPTFYWIAGQHDRLAGETNHHFPGMIESPRHVKLGDRLVGFIPYQDDLDQLASSYQSLNHANFVIGHQPFSLWSPARENVLTPEMVPASVKLVILGDTHVHRQYVRENPDGTRTEFWSPGSTHLRARTEQRDKYVLVVRFKNVDEYDVFPRRLKTREFRSVGPILDETTLAEAIASLDQPLPPDQAFALNDATKVVFFEFATNYPEGRLRMEEAIRKRDMISYPVPVAPPASAGFVLPATTLDFADVVKDIVEPALQPAVYELLESGTPETVLTRLKAERMGV